MPPQSTSLPATAGPQPPSPTQTLSPTVITRPAGTRGPSSPSISYSGQETAPASRGRKGFPLAASGVLGALLSFLVVSAIIWGLWLWVRKRRRARAIPPDWDFAPPPKRLSGMTESTYTARSISTFPQFVSAAEAGAAEQKPRNPFAHPGDELERDPFGGASLRRGNTMGTVSTMSV
ncbi:hypothetical protein AURDEDRAFT_113465 [Auricularia subglabra TFB-10046 SS5]|nr:hypothetical protein AURDEDRAFT_113465 [Auricularia subglabra TFB-10046 SS5]